MNRFLYDLGLLTLVRWLLHYIFYPSLTLWTKVTLDNSLLGQLCDWTNVPWTTAFLENRPLDKCCNTSLKNL